MLLSRAGDFGKFLISFLYNSNGKIQYKVLMPALNAKNIFLLLSTSSAAIPRGLLGPVYMVEKTSSTTTVYTRFLNSKVSPGGGKGGSKKSLLREIRTNKPITIN